MLNQPSAAELNAVIAKWMGWEESMISGWIAPAEQGKHWRIWKKAPPDYAGDLNVWNDVWPVLDERNVGAEMEDALISVIIDELVEDGAEDNGVGALQMARSTARQRAEALGRVIGGEDR